MAQFVDYKKHLQELLDVISQDTFIVRDERDLDTIPNKVNVVIRALAGNVYKNSATIPYEIQVVADDPKEVINIFTQLAKQQNGKSFISLIEEGEETNEYTVFEFYTTPSVVEPKNEVGINDVARLVLYVQLNVLFEVGNVSKIVIDNEEIEFMNGTLGYSVETFANRVSGQNQAKVRKITSTTNLTITMVSKESTFTNNMFYLMSGYVGNHIFEVKITLTTGYVMTLPMMMTQNTFNFAQNTANLPSFNVVLTLADDR